MIFATIYLTLFIPFDIMCILEFIQPLYAFFLEPQIILIMFLISMKRSYLFTAKINH